MRKSEGDLRLLQHHVCVSVCVWLGVCVWVWMGGCVGGRRGSHPESFFEESCNVSLHYSRLDHRRLHIWRLPHACASVPLACYLNELFLLSTLTHSTVTHDYSGVIWMLGPSFGPVAFTREEIIRIEDGVLIVPSRCILLINQSNHFFIVPQLLHHHM